MLKFFSLKLSNKKTENGIIHRTISRGIGDPNVVTIIFAISDMEKAKARMNSPGIKALMMGAGVEGLPTLFF